MSYAPFPLIWGGSGGGGGGGASFGTIQTDAGTYPTASGPGDILTFTTSNPAKYFFTGTALTDTVTLTINGFLEYSFEAISKNLKAYDYSIAYTGDLVDEITYDLGGGLSIVKSFSYNIDDTVSTIVLSGDTPSGIELTKTFTYTSGKVTSVGYS